MGFSRNKDFFFHFPEFFIFWTFFFHSWDFPENPEFFNPMGYSLDFCPRLVEKVTKSYLGSFCTWAPEFPSANSAEFWREWWLGWLGWGASDLGSMGSIWASLSGRWLARWDACLSCSMSMAWTWTCWFWICSIASIRRRFVKSEKGKPIRPHSSRLSHWWPN